MGFAMEEIDVDEDNYLLAKYGLRIPVILAPDDAVLAEGVIDDRRHLRRAMHQAMRSARRR